MKGWGAKIQTMYLVIRCSGCTRMMTAHTSRRHVLCPVCGVTNTTSDARVYVSCINRETAEDIAAQLGNIIHKRNGRDLSEEEVMMLRQRFSAWERQSEGSQFGTEKK